MHRAVRVSVAHRSSEEDRMGTISAAAQVVYLIEGPQAASEVNLKPCRLVHFCYRLRANPFSLLQPSVLFVTAASARLL
jgi:hypothetical protein